MQFGPSLSAPMGGGLMMPPHLQMRVQAGKGRFKSRPVIPNRLTGAQGDNTGPLQMLMKRLAQMKMR